jgi:hypothetical protein
MSTALACMYLKTALKIHDSSDSLRKLQLYLTGKSKIFMNQANSASEIIKSALTSVLRIVNLEKWEE